MKSIWEETDALDQLLDQSSESTVKDRARLKERLQLLKSDYGVFLSQLQSKLPSSISSDEFEAMCRLFDCDLDTDVVMKVR